MSEKNPLVLVVDDIPKNIQVLGNMLKGEHCEIIVATSGMEAIKAARDNQPDLILLDIMMPGMNGLEVCHQLKSSDSTSEIPIIFLTAKNDEDDIVRGFEHGAVDYVTKPFNIAELLSRVKTQLTLKAQKDRIHSQKQAYRELMHVLCHDLVNPLACIVGICKKIKETGDMHLLDVLEDSARNGLDLVGLARKEQRIEESKSPLATVRLQEAIKQAHSILWQRFKDKRINFDVEIEDDLAIMAEPVSFVHIVLANLLTNALKFSYPGTTIRIEAFDDGEKVILLIEDEGIGIPSTMLKQIWNGEDSLMRKGTQGEEGTGFGMLRVRKLLRSWNASIHIRSSQDEKKHGTQVKLGLGRG